MAKFKPSRYSKAIGAAAGGGVGYALATIASWGLEAGGIQPPERVEPAIGIIFAWGLSVFGAYQAPANVDEIESEE